MKERSFNPEQIEEKIGKGSAGTDVKVDLSEIGISCNQLVQLAEILQKVGHSLK